MVKVNSRSTLLFCSSPYLPPIIFFGVGSVEINQDLSLLDQISLRGGIFNKISFWGGIHRSFSFF